MSTDIDKLLKIKEKIEEAKEGKAKAEGKLEDLMTRLEKDFGVSTIEAAKKSLADLKAKAEALEKEISDGVKELEEEFEL